MTSTVSSESEPTNVAELEAFCPHLAVLPAAAGSPELQLQAVGLAPNGRLYANSTLLARDATSFIVSGTFVIWTNSAHEARFLPLSSLSSRSTDGLSADGPASAVEEVHGLGRRVERGSRIVTAVPSSMALILQMPRGNLETICPRPLVLEVIRRDLDR